MKKNARNSVNSPSTTASTPGSIARRSGRVPNHLEGGGSVRSASLSAADLSKVGSSSMAATASSTPPKKATTTTKDVSASNPTPWKHPAELAYICREDWSQDLMIEYLCKKSFSIPPRDNKTANPFFQVTARNSSPISVPRKYRIPLLFLAKFQWDSLRLVLNSTNPMKEWQDYKFDIIHISRLCQHFLDQAKSAKEKGGVKGIDKMWRSPMFDRVLTRFYHHWFISQEWSIKHFYEEFEEEEYEIDVLKYDWSRWALKGHKGFQLTKDEIQIGITAEQYMQGLTRSDEGGWTWSSTANAPSVITPATSDSNAKALPAQLITVTELANIPLAPTTSAPAHNTIEVKRERLDLNERVLNSNAPDVIGARTLPKALPTNGIDTITTITGSGSSLPTPRADELSTASPKPFPSPSTGSKRPREETDSSSAENQSKKPRTTASKQLTSPLALPPAVSATSMLTRAKATSEGYTIPMPVNHNDMGLSNSKTSKLIKSPQTPNLRAIITETIPSSSSGSKPTLDARPPRQSTAPAVDPSPATAGPARPDNDVSIKPSPDKHNSRRSPSIGSHSSLSMTNSTRPLRPNASSPFSSPTFPNPASTPKERGTSSELVSRGPSPFSGEVLTVLPDIPSISLSTTIQMPNSRSPKDLLDHDQPASAIVCPSPLTNTETPSISSKISTPRITGFEPEAIPFKKVDHPPSNLENSLELRIPQIDVASDVVKSKEVLPPINGNVTKPTPMPLRNDPPVINVPTADPSSIPKQIPTWDDIRLRPLVPTHWKADLSPKRVTEVEKHSTQRSGAPIVLPEPISVVKSSNMNATFSAPATRTESQPAFDSIFPTLSTKAESIAPPPPATDASNATKPLSDNMDVDDQSSCPPNHQSNTGFSSSDQSVGLLTNQSTRTKSLHGILLLRDLLDFLRSPSWKRNPSGLFISDDTCSNTPNPRERPPVVDARTRSLVLDGENAMTIEQRLEILNHVSVSLGKLLITLRGDELETRVDALDKRLQQEFEVVWTSENHPAREPESHAHITEEKEVQTLSPTRSSQETQTLLPTCSSQETQTLSPTCSSQETQTLSPTCSSQETQTSGEEETETTRNHVRLVSEAIQASVEPDLKLLENVGIQTDIIPESPSTSPSLPGAHSLSPDATMVDLCAPPTPEITLPEPPKIEIDALERDQPVKKAMMSIMRTMADLLDYSLPKDSLSLTSVKGKDRELYVGTPSPSTFVDSPIVAAIMHEFKAMKDDLRQTQQWNREEFQSITALHRAEVQSLKDEIRNREQQGKADLATIRSQHSDEVEGLRDSIRLMEKDREKYMALGNDARLPALEILELRRRIACLESLGRLPGSISDVPIAPSQSSTAMPKLEIPTHRQLQSHPLGHLVTYDYDDTSSVSSPRTNQPFLREASSSKPGTPMSSERHLFAARQSDSMDMDEKSMPMPVKTQRKPYMMAFPRPHVG